MEYIKEQYDSLEKFENYKEEISEELDNHNILKEIYNYWMYERENDKTNKNCLSNFLFSKKLKFEEEDNGFFRLVFPTYTESEQKLYDEFRLLEKKIHDDEDKMLQKLLTIRRRLWV